MAPTYSKFGGKPLESFTRLLRLIPKVANVGVGVLRSNNTQNTTVFLEILSL